MTMPHPDPQIPRPADVIGRGVDALLEARPTAEPHLDRGRWGDVVTGYRAQFDVARSRLVAETRATRLPYATGDALTDLAASEYDTPRAAGSLPAIGEVVLTRTVVHYVADGIALRTAPAATDRASLGVLMAACLDTLLVHLQSVWSVGLGLVGAHGSYAPLPVRPATWQSTTENASAQPMSETLDDLNWLKSTINYHLGTVLAMNPWHTEADTANAITAADATASHPSDPWDANSVASRNRALALGNACYASLVAHLALEARAGTIRTGTPWAILPAPTAVPAVAGAQYAAAQDVPVSTGVRSVTVPIAATVDGPGGNVPAWAAGGPVLTFTHPVLFDSAAKLKLATTSLRAAGGTDGQSDPELVRSSRAAARGTGGPTVPALTAGALRTLGASRTVVLENVRTGAAVVYPVDPSWSQSDAWVAAVEQTLRATPDTEPWVGFGLRADIGRVVNRIVRLDIVCELRDAAYLADTSDLTALIQTALRAYFDDRQDWHTWRTAALRGVVSTVDRMRISACPQVIVRDENGAPLTEPSVPTGGDTLTHYVFADNAVLITYTRP